MIALSEEQRAVRALALDFAEKEIAPRVAAWDKNAEFSRETWDKMTSLGMGAIIVPEGLFGLARKTKRGLPWEEANRSPSDQSA